MPKFVVIGTDVALWLFALGAAYYMRRIWRDPELRRTWSHVTRDTAAMCAALVLLVFVALALLDSLHYRPRLDGTPAATVAPEAGAPGTATSAAPAAPATTVFYSTRTYSVLDALLRHALESREESYSAPLAYHAFQKRTAVVDGREVRDFPRLKFGGARLADPQREWLPDLVRRSLAGLAGGLLAAVLATGLAIGNLARKHGGARGALRDLALGLTELPWRAVVVTFALLAAFAGWVAALWPAYHVFGTDLTGNDVLYQTLKSVRTAVVIGTLSTAATLPLAVALGILSGFYKGWVDDLIQYVYTVLSSIPSVLLIAALVLLIQVLIDSHAQWFDTSLERAEFRLFLLCVVLGITGWATLCRLLRAETLKLGELDFVQAARAFGVSDLRIMARHVLPNVMHLVLIVSVLDFSALVLYEAVLSYVGIGVDPSSSSFGSMINLARNEMARDPIVWWNLAAAFFFMLTLVLAANIFADAVRDAFDPRARALWPRRIRAMAPATADATPAPAGSAAAA